MLINRNPFSAKSKSEWVGRWAEVIVKFNGRLLSPAEFVRADTDAGTVDFIEHPIQQIRVGKLIANVKTQRHRGTVLIMQAFYEDCGQCKNVLQGAQWWLPQVYPHKDYSRNSVQARIYSAEQMAGFDRARAQHA